jgi:glycosyltransferase involved in cell wall biosynthesis
MVEHFGMSTVEAMAGGCVPVVINKGGQSEIVEHGISGFVWNTLDELKNYTARLMSDDNLLRQMSAGARMRAQMFSREVFLTNFVGRLLCAICVFFVFCGSLFLPFVDKGD